MEKQRTWSLALLGVTLLNFGLARAESPKQKEEAATAPNAYIEALKNKASCEERRAQSAIERWKEASEELEEERETVAQLERRLEERSTFSARTDVFFRTNEAVLTDDARTHLKPLAKQAASDETLFLRIEGYTDDRGAKAQNQALSEARAEAVKAYFLEQGVDEAQIVSVGKGASHPIAKNDSLEGRALNRRTEISLETGVGGAGPGR